MDQIITYLTFNGNCKEAMTFYQQCLGGELTFQTVGDSPKSEEFSNHIKAYILEAVLKKGNMILKATDLVDDSLAQGNTQSILLECKHEEEMKTYYEKLARHGQKTFPIADKFFGGWSGMLRDQYGFHWLLRCRS